MIKNLANCMLSKITKILAFYLLAGVCHVAEASDFPEELMYEDKPIDPSVMLGIQFYSVTEKIKVSDSDSGFIDGSEYQISVTFNSKTNTATKEYSLLEGYYRPFDIICESYQYAGTFNGKHIIMSTIEQYGTTALFSTSIDLIKREGDYIVSIDSIGGGERSYGGMHKLDSFENGVLKYRHITPYSEIVYLLDENSAYIDLLSNLPGYTDSGGFWKLDKVTISDFSDGFNKEIYGIGLRELHLYKAWQQHAVDNSAEDAEYDHEAIAELCFCETAISYIELGKVDFMMDEIEEFASRVANCIESKGKWGV